MRKRWCALEGVSPEDERVLRSRRDPPSDRGSSSPRVRGGAAARPHLVVLADETPLGIPLDLVRRVSARLRIARAPFLAPPAFALAETGGEVVAVLDAGLLAGAGRIAGPHGAFVELRTAAGRCFLAASAVDGIRPLERARVGHARLPAALTLAAGGEWVLEPDRLLAGAGASRPAPQNGENP